MIQTRDFVQLHYTYSVSGIKKGTLLVYVSRSCAIIVLDVLRISQNVPFYSGHTVYSLVS